nr:neurofilament medium polypeptide-like [Aegilops tauschii subsp. strangulata]
MGKKAAAPKGKRATAAQETVAGGSKKRAAELDKKRRGDVVFFPSNLDGDVLKARYGYLWGREVPKGMLPALDEELGWSSGLVEKATKVETNMYKRTSKVEEAYIRRRLEEERALRVAAKEKAGKAAEEKGEVEGEGSSHSRDEAQATEQATGDDPAGNEPAGDEPAGDEPSGIEALYTAAAEVQEEEEAEEVEEPEEEWLMTGPQAHEPVLDQRSCTRVTNRGAAVPDPAPAAKKVKKIASKSNKPDAMRRQSSCLAGAKTPPAKQSTAAGVDSSSQSGSISSHNSSSSEPPAPREDEDET